jgi:hypothetical protein
MPVLFWCFTVQLSALAVAMALGVQWQLEATRPVGKGRGRIGRPNLYVVENPSNIYH